jgi:hypothetical protein
MHKNIFKIFVLVFGCITVFTTCNRDEPNQDDLISEQIIARICEANTKLFAEKEISISHTTKDYFIFGTELWFERKMEVNLSAKKSFAVLKSNDVFEDFHYYDETTHYCFQSATDTEPETSISEKISTGYWKYYSWDLPYLQDTMVKTIGKWREENGKFVVDNPYTGTVEEYRGSKYYLTLSENNKYLKFEIKSATGENLQTSDYSYTANPVFPAEYQQAQFSAVKQYSVNVNWGGTYGTDTYYSDYTWDEDNRKYFNIGKIGTWGNCPKVAGKLPLFYYDEAHTQLILDDMEKTNFYVDYDYDDSYENLGYYWFFNGFLYPETDGITVYVQWEDEETVYKKYGNI